VSAAVREGADIEYHALWRFPSITAYEAREAEDTCGAETIVVSETIWVEKGTESNPGAATAALDADRSVESFRAAALLTIGPLESELALGNGAVALVGRTPSFEVYWIVPFARA